MTKGLISSSNQAAHAMADNVCAQAGTPVSLVGETVFLETVGTADQAEFVVTATGAALQYCYGASGGNFAAMTVSASGILFREEISALSSAPSPACTMRATLTSLPDATFQTLSNTFTAISRPIIIQVSGNVLTVTLPPYTYTATASPSAQFGVISSVSHCVLCATCCQAGVPVLCAPLCMAF